MRSESAAALEERWTMLSLQLGPCGGTAGAEQTSARAESHAPRWSDTAQSRRIASDPRPREEQWCSGGSEEGGSVFESA